MNKEVSILQLSYGNYVSLNDYVKLQQENQQLKKEKKSLMTALNISREKYNNDKVKYRRKYKNLKKQKDDVVNLLKIKIARFNNEEDYYLTTEDFEDLLRMLGGEEMKVGDYVRYTYENCIYIGKIDFISEVMCGLDEKLEIEISNCLEGILKRDIIKSSPRIIDLIEVGDYVNGKRVTSIDTEKRKIYVEEMYYFNKKDIKSIVTKEQFSQMKYKIGEIDE